MELNFANNPNVPGNRFFPRASVRNTALGFGLVRLGQGKQDAYGPTDL